MPSSKKAVKNNKNLTTQNIANILIKTGILLVVISFILFFIFVFPVIKLEIKYFFGHHHNLEYQTDNVYESSETEEITPVDTNFTIVIPKIYVNSKIIKDVDPNNSFEYQYKLTMGVAHAKGSAYPDQIGNVFLFAHSSDNILNANRYNSVFYLLNKLEKDDEIMVYYEDQLYKYKVEEIKIVNSDQIEYFRSDPGKRMITLMTCWPFGTTLKRLIVTGIAVE